MSFQFTSQHALFIQRMLESQEQEQKGFELLLQKNYFAEFFDHLKEAGLFHPSRAPGPQPAHEPGYVQIPYWAPLDYLEACARRAGESGNTALANKVLAVVRACSAATNAAGEPVHNYHTSRKFAEILGLLPTSALATEDVDLIRRWLSDPYDRGLVCSELDKGLMNKLLISQAQDDWSKAVRLLGICIELRAGRGEDEFVTAAEDYWLKQLLEHHSESLGRKAGAYSASVFMEGLGQLFSSRKRGKLGYLYRPAIEEHPQNHDWHGAENRYVEGLRDVLLSWVDADSVPAIEYLKSLLGGEHEISRRIAIHVINHRWQIAKRLFLESIGPELFRMGHLHELFQLLSAHFQELNIEQQNAVLDTIDRIDVARIADNSERLLRLEKCRWLSAIVGQGNARADSLLDKLGQGDDAVGVPPHPDFLSYMESRWGDGDSIYQVEELLAFANGGKLIGALNEFKQTDRWDGPSLRALVHTLEAAIVAEPELFLGDLAAFLHAKRPYQYGLISGLKQVWEKPSASRPNVDWARTWDRLLDFLHDLISPPDFWAENVEPNQDLNPDRDWIPPVIADLLHAGTRDDGNAYVPALLPKGLRLIEILLARAEACQAVSDDPMTTAINSPKGKAIEALFSHALRQCRVCHATAGEHAACWMGLQPIFDRELEKAKGGNFEFSTLAAAYLPNLEYLSPAWLRENIRRIFPVDYPDNFDSAIAGLAYASATKSNYLLLLDAGVIDAAQREYEGKSKYDDRIIERVALAYLWGVEELDSPRFAWWFDHADLHALQTISHFFWSVSKQQLSDEQIALVRNFWQRCINVGQPGDKAGQALLSCLSRLACYVTAVGPSEEALLIAVAPFAHVGHNADWFIEELERLTDNNPQAVFRILSRLLEAYEPLFDFEDRLKSIVLKLHTHQMHEESLRLVDRLRRLKGMPELFHEIKTTFQA